MKIILKMNDINYDLTPISDISNLHKEIEISISTDGTFNTASFIIPSVDKYELGPDIDFSRGLIRNSLVTIERDNISFEWRIMGDSITENQNGTYTHTIQLIDRRSETTGINLPGMSLTQSKSEQGDFIRSISTINKSNAIGNYYYNGNDTTFKKTSPYGINITDATPIVPVIRSIESANLSVINGLTLKEVGREYTVSLSMTLVNTQANYYNRYSGGGYVSYLDYSNGIINYTVNIYSGSNLISSDNGSINPAVVKSSNTFTLKPINVDLTTSQYSKTVKVTPTIEETIRVEIITSGKYNSESKSYVDPVVNQSESDSLSINELSLIIYSPESIDPSRRTLRYHLERVLDNIFLDEQPYYKLSSLTYSRLEDIISPEFTIEGYNLFQAIQEVADYLGSSWLINKDNEIDFIFFDDDTVNDIDESQKQYLTASSDLNDYASSIQLNAENIASNTVKREVELTVRSTDEISSQITTDNLMIKTNEPINYIDKVLVSGITLKLNNIDVNQEWDITDRVLVKEQWDILPSEFNKGTGSFGRDGLNKNNTLYFIRGQKGIHGLSYVGGVAPKFIGTNSVNRSLFETLAAQAYQATGQSASNKDEGRVTHNGMKVSIDYFPFTSSRVHLYKDDQSGFQIERRKYFNESSKVNDPELLGKVAQNNINRLGGTEYTLTGYIDTLASIPRLGTINSQGRRLTKVIIQMTQSYIRYTTTYISDYTKISKFVGKKSDYRLYEIPNTSVINSDRIKRLRIIFGSLDTDANNSLFVRNLMNIKPTVPIVAGITFNHSLGTSTVYTSVSTNEFGKTGSWKVKALNNYSFGLKKITKILEGVEVDYQEEVKYTDNLGRIDSFDIDYYSTYKAGDNYPLTATNLTVLIPQETYTYDKDAREIFSFEKEISFGSIDVDKYRIYDGMVRYNSFINGRTDYDIECRVLNYIPNKNDLKVDLSKTNGLATVTGVSFSDITVNVTQPGLGLVFYDKKTSDLLLVVKDNITSGTYTIPYGTTAELSYKEVNFYPMGGTSVPDQRVLNGTILTEPTTSKLGYIFDGWYTDFALTTVWNSSAPITDDLDLYAKWIKNTNLKWTQVSTSISDEIITPQINSYVCPTDLVSYLPDANDYNIDYIVEIKPIRLCDEQLDFCIVAGNGDRVKICPSKQYKVTE